jgi:hypothetical protein
MLCGRGQNVVKKGAHLGSSNEELACAQECEPLTFAHPSFILPHLAREVGVLKRHGAGEDGLI